MGKIVYRRKRSSRGRRGTTASHSARRERMFFLPRIPLKFIFITIVVIVTAAGLWFLARSQIFALRDVRIEGTENIAPQVLADRVHGYLTKQRFIIFPQNFLFVDTKGIEDSLELEFPRIESSRVSREIKPLSLRVVITERKLFAFWCQALPDAVSYGVTQCFVVDRTGVVFDAVPPAQGALVLTLVEIGTGAPPALGAKVIEAETLGMLEQLRKDVKTEANVNLVRMVSVNKRELRGETAEGWVMLFDPSGDLALQISALRETLIQKLTPEKRKGLQYIDLRTPGRVFYK